MVKLDSSKYIGEQITSEDILNWDRGSIVTIQAGTGAGKSHFIKNNLYNIAKENGSKILFLIHRRNCVEQFHKEVVRDGKDGVIDIMTYQKIEYDIMNGFGFNFSEYEYIVSDEFHYFMSDANFNHTTDISLNRMLRQNNITRIFMSATGDYMTKYINNYRNMSTVNYEVETGFNHVNNVEFYTSDDSLEQYIDDIISNDEKAIVFIQSATKAYRLYRKYEEYALFNCGKSDKHYKYVNDSKITDMLVNERFDEQVLITTTVMDSGVNIHDKEVSKVILDIEDKDVFIQCLGRRRIDREDNNDMVDIYVKRMSNEQLGGRITQANNRLKKVRYLEKYGTSRYVDKYGRRPDTSGMVYDGRNEYGDLVKKVNDLVKFKTGIDVLVFEKMIGMQHQNFINEIVLKRKPKQYTMKWKTERVSSLSEYLESRVGDVMLTVADRKELIETVNVRRNRNLLRGLSTINRALEELGVDYKVVDYSIDKVIDGKRKRYSSVWEVVRR